MHKDVIEKLHGKGDPIPNSDSWHYCVYSRCGRNTVKTWSRKHQNKKYRLDARRELKNGGGPLGKFIPDTWMWS